MQWEVCNLAGTVAPLHRQLTLSTNVWHRQQHPLFSLVAPVLASEEFL